jgi:hypothetical protein
MNGSVGPATPAQFYPWKEKARRDAISARIFNPGDLLPASGLEAGKHPTFLVLIGPDAFCAYRRTRRIDESFSIERLE